MPLEKNAADFKVELVRDESIKSIYEKKMRAPLTVDLRLRHKITASILKKMLLLFRGWIQRVQMKTTVRTS